MGIRAMAWTHFATSAKNVTSHTQAAAAADEMLTEFDKRFPQFKADDESYAADIARVHSAVPSQAELEAQLDVVRKAQELDEVLEIVAPVGQVGESVPAVVARLVKAAEQAGNL